MPNPHRLDTSRSHFDVPPSVQAWISPALANGLRTFYLKHGVHLTYVELLLEIERRFGKRLVQEICIPHGITTGACLVMAAAMARNGPYR